VPPSAGTGFHVLEPVPSNDRYQRDLESIMSSIVDSRLDADGR
jgi:hypothetical protein